MFGGIGFMVGGHLCCSVTGEGLLVRVTPATRDELLSHPAVHAMVMGKRAMRGYLRVSRDALESDRELSIWVQKSLAAAATLPEKSEGAKKRSER